MKPSRFGKWLNRSLGRRLGFNLLACGVLGMIAILLLLHAVIDQRFGALEEQQVDGHVARTRAMIETLKKSAQTDSLDWAVWTDTFNYIRSQDPAYETTNISASAFKNMELQAMGFVRFDGSFTNAAYFNLATSEVNERARQDFMRAISTPQFRATMQSRKWKTGFMRLGGRILVVGGSQILKSDGSGPSEGYLVTGKELDDRTISEALHLPAALELATGGMDRTIQRTESEIEITQAIDSIEGTPVARIRSTIPRDLKRQGEALIWITGGGVSGLLLLMFMLLDFRFRTILARPIAAFQGHVSQISRSGELRHFGGDRRHDELGALYREFNVMADELNMLRAKVEAQSFEIGRSDSAIGLMHNMRNAISPVQTILSRLSDRMQFPADANVRRALAELREPTDSPHRRESLVSFLDAAIARAREDLSEHRIAVQDAMRGIGQVAEVLTSCPSDSPTEQSRGSACELATVVETSSAIAKHHAAASILFRFDAERGFMVAMPRVLLAQVLDNIITNAVEAITASRQTAGEIIVLAKAESEASDSAIRLTITDNGDGFDPADTTDLFARGKTYRDKQSGGIGLHWCANTLNAFGGAISITSPGRDHGATVAILLPQASAKTHPLSEAA